MWLLYKKGEKDVYKTGIDSRMSYNFDDRRSEYDEWFQISPASRKLQNYPNDQVDFQAVWSDISTQVQDDIRQLRECVPHSQDKGGVLDACW